MFDQLVESEPQGADFKNRRRYFVLSSVVVGILFSTAVVISIFAANYDLGTGNFELVEMIAPDDMAPVDPEPERERPQPQNAAPSTSQLPTRQVNMARIDEVPTVVPESVSTVRNTQMTRPLGRFNIDRLGVESEGTSGPSGREGSTTGPVGLGGPENTTASTRTPEPEETTPPPPIKRAEPPKSVSKGVLNGIALNLPKPNYPATAKLAGARGQVSVQVTIDESGRVVAANAVGGHPLLRAEAERAARGARFSPTKLSDVPVKVTGVITYNFIK